MVVFIPKKRTHTDQRFFEALGNNQRLEMVLIQEGTFTMGSPDNEEKRRDAEGPQREVTVSTFLMGRYPVTQSQWRQVSKFDPVDPDIEFPPNPSRFKNKQDSDHRPVEQVNWHQANEFCARLNQFLESRSSTPLNRAYRLPSEAEWEYACRAGTTTPFYCGETISTDVANYDGNYTYGRGPKGRYREETTPVGSLESGNSWGPCDMHGNVWEWCQDHWHENYKYAPLDGSAWLENTPQSENRRVNRGGSWLARPWFCRSACRNRYHPDGRDAYLGFRVVLAPQ
ncbi:MAG: formylglycine-generating enzyme family protein [Cyanobacteria bacterium P01_F01_bin.150]